MSSCVHIVHIIQWSVLLLFKQNLDLAIMETSSEVSEIKMTVEIHRDCWNIQNTPYHNVNWPSGEGLKARFFGPHYLISKDVGNIQFFCFFFGVTLAAFLWSMCPGDTLDSVKRGVPLTTFCKQPST